MRWSTAASRDGPAPLLLEAGQTPGRRGLLAMGRDGPARLLLAFVIAGAARSPTGMRLTGRGFVGFICSSRNSGFYDLQLYSHLAQLIAHLDYTPIPGCLMRVGPVLRGWRK